MVRPKGGKVVAGCAVALLVACSTKKAVGPKYDSVRAMAKALDDAGVDCRDLTADVVEGSSGDTGISDSTARAKCTLDGESITLSIYRDAESQATAEGQHGSLACGSGGSGGYFTGFNFVKGDKWDVMTRTQSQATKVALALGGQAITEDFGCGAAT